ncbi:UDP-N-acetylglucosamine 2-epimerase (non-hydrolyzing) [Pontixanthobacter gangjinensis]|uniref:UDP-N-acetylglucosamine 2-epimerase (Non-hydrolyzing) n=1 Tax=Christiangramia aestuarii TaxID=1028746 RepID=A0A7K1LLS7_9FLAO|nr:UDP-N-acetylglucosamine 2-epimerase (non-hydrolyzing) [Christiangramia aestuarii]MUP41784.1 UDP-N-acetylglucosamine 2-epimerase (non-hydrolyzing) [Christiangramia aestuarii]
MKIDLIAGARPNFVKIASLIHANNHLNSNLDFRIIHTGQHYDKNLSDNFFKLLEIPEPDFNLSVGSGSQATQTALIMQRYEDLLISNKPDLCIVVGDVTSSMACAITAKKLNIKIAHIEAGLRSYDWSMPEEVNRVLIDSIGDYFFTTTQKAKQYLLTTGKESSDVHFVGNTMIDTLIRNRRKFAPPQLWKELELEKNEYFVMTLHRPSNVSELNKLQHILKEIEMHSKGLPVIFPVHPRTAVVLKEKLPKIKNLHFTAPLNYLEFNYLVERSKAVITDSGGITEETTFLNVPCITIRENTERPETVYEGTNEVIGTIPENIGPALKRLFNNDWKKGSIPELWDGKTGERIISILSDL